jgi:hypothetical protein
MLMHALRCCFGEVVTIETVSKTTRLVNTTRVICVDITYVITAFWLLFI